MWSIHSNGFGFSFIYIDYSMTISIKNTSIWEIIRIILRKIAEQLNEGILLSSSHNTLRNFS